MSAKTRPSGPSRPSRPGKPARSVESIDPADPAPAASRQGRDTVAAPHPKDLDHRLRLSLDSLLEGCQIIGFDWTYLYLNDTAARHGRRTRDELIGRTVTAEYPGIEKTESFAAMKECMEKRTPRRMEVLFPFPDGGTGWFELSIQPVPEGIFVLSIDITGERKRKEALRQSEEELRLIAENIGDLIALFDRDGRRLYNSPSYRTMLGITGDVVEQDSFLYIHPDDRDRIREIFAETVRTGATTRSEYRFLLPDGTVRNVESNASPVRDDRGEVSKVVVVSRDVTERKRIERQFLRTQRMESIGALAGGIAHDLNNLLAPILVSIFALRQTIRSKRARTMLDALETSAKRGAELVKQVLSFARGIEGERSVIRVGDLISEIEKMIRVAFPKSIRVTTGVQKGLWPISADPTQIHQVFMNLAVNARDAMPNGGTFTLSAVNVKADRQYAKMHPGMAEANYVLITVSDTGTGIPPQIIDRIFEPFYSTKELGKGTGLGLSTTHSIVTGHGGFIDVYSDVGKGTTFKLHIPMHAAGPGAPARAHAKPPAGRGERVLIVDDEAAIREITRTTLEAYGYSALTAAGGAKAAALYAKKGGKIDVVITDIMMPFMDGHALIRALQDMNPGIRVLAVSGLTVGGFDPRYPDSSPVRFLQKPYTAESLLRALRDLLDLPV